MLGKIEVSIGGKTRRIVFGQNAWYLFCKMHSINISDIGLYFADTVSNPDSFRDIVFCGLKASDLALNNAVEYNQYTVGEWLDEVDETTASEILTTLLESRAQGDGKKKEAGKK